MNKDFREIDLKGGEYTIHVDGSIAFSFSKPMPLELTHMVCVSFNGYILDTAGFITIDFPFPSVQIIMNPDEENLYGRKCPNCTKYFRNKACSKYMYCPYCVYKGNSIEFITEAQMNFIGIMLTEFNKVMSENNQVPSTINVDDIVKSLKDNQSKFKLLDETQQLMITCKKENCRNIYDILGHYGFCPSCRSSNIQELIIEELHNEREIDKIVTFFDSLANYARDNIFIFVPNTIKRTKEISKLSFQKIDIFPDQLYRLCGIDVMAGINTDQKRLMKLMYEVRHLRIHRKGLVDQKFIDNAQEYLNEIGYSALRIGQHFKFSIQDELKNMTIFSSLVSKMSLNLLNGINEIIDARDKIPIPIKSININK